MPQAGFYEALNQIVSTNALVATLVSWVISATAAGLYRLYLRRKEGRLSWQVTNDVPINQGDSPGTVPPHAGQRRWDITFTYPDPSQPTVTGSQPTISRPGLGHAGASPTSANPAGTGLQQLTYPVENGSLVIFELRNNGRRPIYNTELTNLAAYFQGRRFVDFKVRDNDSYRDHAESQAESLPKPGTKEHIMLPLPECLASRDKISLFVLLDEARPRARHETPAISGKLESGNFVHLGQRRGRAHIALLVVVALVVIAGIFAAGTSAGDALGHHVAAPPPRCGQGTLTIEGSTAFAPIMTLVATEYEQSCPRAQITVTANNSGRGLSQLEGAPKPPDIAMYDGLPLEELKPGINGQPIGDIIMAVVGNDSLPGSAFRQGLGLSHDAITQAFAQAGSAIPGLPGLSVQTVGRPGNSGTREAFIQTVAGGNEQANGTASTQQTTMELLGYVNETPDAIGYAEADALPFFPNVREIAIDGVLPSPEAVLDGKYTFVTTEHLYTRGQLTGLGEDFVSYLTSSPVLTQLRASTSFLGCAELAGSALSSDCAAG